MRVVDSSAWIEWLMASPLGEMLSAEIPERDQCVVPTIVQLEMTKWLTREVGEDRADQFIAFTEMCHVAPLDTATALLAAESCRRHRLATADAIVYATASLHDAGLVTCDAHFKSLPGVIYLPRTS